MELRSIHVETTPIRRINTVTSPQDLATYKEEAQQFYQRYLADNNDEPLLDFVRHHLSQEPEASDVVRDLLAYLAEEMLHLNKQKQRLQGEFLGYLVSTLHISTRDEKTGLDVLTKQRSQLLNYPGDYRKGEPSLAPDVLWAIIVKNHSHFAARPTSTLKSHILAHYEPHRAEIDDLQECLKRTDRLIDQIVYRLYGLTDDEIAVVEEKG